jgi:hypothetical protein
LFLSRWPPRFFLPRAFLRIAFFSVFAPSTV